MDRPPTVMTVTKLEGKSMEDTVIQSLMNVTTQNRYPLIMVVMATHLLAIMVAASLDIKRYLASILVLLVEQMDTY